MIYFAFCIHNHQPVGNFENVLEESYQRSYLPFLKALSHHPAIKLSLHTSGFLLDWIIENHIEYIDLLRTMVARGQVEIMGGGHYEPILQVIPEYDRRAQITMMSDRIEDIFKVRPRGIWLAERIWEPSLPTTLKSSGIEYLLVDDYHFIKSGLKREDLGGYYITEDQGDVIKVFPGNEALRYYIPFKPVEELEGYLKDRQGFLRKGNCAIYGDDGEKFGVWPGTSKWVYDDGWLERFFTKIESCGDWLKPVTLAEYLDRQEPVGRVYLPTTSYMEMGEWSLPAESSKEYTELVEDVKNWKDGERVRRFLQGGAWRNFFSKYPESNWMHKRMLLVSKELKKRTEGREWDEKLSAAERHLYKGQCNDAYWHGVFGGLYLPHLRTEVYKNLLEAENLIEAGLDFANGSYIFASDIDADDHAESVIRTKDLNLFLSPRNGGSLVELDYRPKAVNLSNTLSRWFEGYHHKLEARTTENHGGAAKSIHDIVKVKEEGLEKYLKYDTYKRASFIDRFIGKDETFDSFYGNTYKELGDFHNGKYEPVIKPGSLILSRHGQAGGSPFFVKKEITPSMDSFSVFYRVEGRDFNGFFGVELNLLLPCCDGPACKYDFIPPAGDEIGLGSSGELKNVDEAALSDEFAGVSLKIVLESPARLWRHPVHTVSLSEGGFEKIYQGSCLLFLFPVSFKGKGSLEIGFNLTAGLAL